MGSPQKYFTPEARRERNRELRRESAQRTRQRDRAGANLIYDPADERVEIPPEIKAAQQRRIDWIRRRVDMGQITPNQYLLGEPIKHGKVCNSVSSTQILAMLGVEWSATDAVGRR